MDITSQSFDKLDNKLNTISIQPSQTIQTNLQQIQLLKTYLQAKIQTILTTSLPSMNYFKHCRICPEQGIFPDLKHPIYSVLNSFLPTDYEIIVYHSIPQRFQNAILFLQIDYLQQLLQTLRYEELLHCINQYQPYFQGIKISSKNLFHDLARGYSPHLQLKEIPYKEGFLQIMTLILDSLQPNDIYNYLTAEDSVQRTPIDMALSYKKPLILQQLLSYCPQYPVSSITLTCFSTYSETIYTQQLKLLLAYHVGSQTIYRTKVSTECSLCLYRKSSLSVDIIQHILGYSNSFVCHYQWIRLLTIWNQSK